jgi:hypothetical protein
MLDEKLTLQRLLFDNLAIKHTSGRCAPPQLFGKAALCRIAVQQAQEQS